MDTGPSREVMKHVKKLFPEADVDKQGEVGFDGLMFLVTRLAECLGTSLVDSVPNGEQGLLRLVKKSMVEYDEDKSGLISYGEFLTMISRKPWIDLLVASNHNRKSFIRRSIIQPRHSVLHRGTGL